MCAKDYPSTLSLDDLIMMNPRISAWIPVV